MAEQIVCLLVECALQLRFGADPCPNFPQCFGMWGEPTQTQTQRVLHVWRSAIIEKAVLRRQLVEAVQRDNVRGIFLVAVSRLANVGQHFAQDLIREGIHLVRFAPVLLQEGPVNVDILAGYLCAEVADLTAAIQLQHSGELLWQFPHLQDDLAQRVDDIRALLPHMTEVADDRLGIIEMMLAVLVQSTASV